jgi:hypothetical protein
MSWPDQVRAGAAVSTTSCALPIFGRCPLCHHKTSALAM